MNITIMSEQASDYRVIIGKNIKLVLRQKGKTQSWLADELDMYKSQLNGYIKGKSMPNPELFQKIANTLGLSVEELLCREVVSSADRVESINYKMEGESLLGDDEIEIFSLENELKAELSSISNYAKTLKQSTSNDKIISLSNLIYNKAIFVKENME